jgi:superfamily I DNA and RNA helicase
MEFLEMINIVRGSSNKPVSSGMLIKYFEKNNELEGTLYLGYPILGSAEGSFNIDALLVSPSYGIVIFDIVEGTDVEDRTELQDDIFTKMQAKLMQYKGLVKKRQLMIYTNVITYAPGFKESIENFDFTIATNETELNDILFVSIWEHPEYYLPLLATIQAVTTIKARSKREKVTRQDSKGAILKKLEDSIANLDANQSQAVIETVEGPQRIRGLAGSGKTIVLALKVAYLHSKHPDWQIAVTFNTRSLKNQFIDLIMKFTLEHKHEEPDWNKVRIIHAWGSPNMPGIYYEICKDHNVEYYDFDGAKRLTLFRGDEFNAICDKAFNEIRVYNEKYDVILIDEAQDFSEAFLNLCYNSLKSPKRLIWAYDELQRLNRSSMKSPEEIFGNNKDGTPRVQLRNEEGKPKQDIMLKKCYRNSRPILVTAHALGFGVYRDEDELVQMFDEPTLWKEIGYDLFKGELANGKSVILGRTNETSPLFLEQHSHIDDILVCKHFDDENDQSKWIASEIKKNLTVDELEYRDIIVINANPKKTQTDVGKVRKLLLEYGINSHIAGVNTSPEGFYSNESITFTGIYRAKGNESAMVYLMNTQYCYDRPELIKKRNILFTAITRSKAWVRICGFGEDMEGICKEVETTRDKKFTLDFVYPTKEQMDKMNIIHRDMTKEEEKIVKLQKQNMESLLESLRDKKLFKEDISPELLEMLHKELFDEE